MPYEGNFVLILKTWPNCGPSSYFCGPWTSKSFEKNHFLTYTNTFKNDLIFSL